MVWQSSLPLLLAIDWQRLPDMPKQGPATSGFQDSDGGWVSNSTVVTAFGYSSGGVPGFLNSSWALDLSARKPQWSALPPAPVPGRQEVSATVIDGAVYFVGGFDYSPPYARRDFLKLGHNAQGEWAWTTLPPFPYPVMSQGVASVGSKIYAFGGCDYDSKAFYCSTDRNGGNPNMGSRLWEFDTATSMGWKELARNPGPPRWVMSLTSAYGDLFLLGGAISNPNGTHGLLDCWRYDTTEDTWHRLADLPFSSTNWQTNGPGAFLNRYIILVGGNQYSTVMFANGTVGPAKGHAHQLCPKPASPRGDATQCWPGCYTNTTGQEYNSDILVYDVALRQWGKVKSTASQDPDLLPGACSGQSAFPMNDNLPQTNVISDGATHGRIFTVGGECDPRLVGASYYGHYPTLALLGHITVVDSSIVV